MATKSASSTARRKPGRPSKYREEYAEQAYRLSLLGATDEELAEFFGVSKRTISSWKETQSAFLQALRKGKDEADAKVVESLYQQALSGNVTACIFWLKNRQRHRWRDKYAMEHAGPGGGPIQHEHKLPQEQVDAVARALKARLHGGEG